MCRHGVCKHYIKLHHQFGQAIGHSDWPVLPQSLCQAVNLIWQPQLASALARLGLPAGCPGTLLGKGCTCGGAKAGWTAG